MKYNVYDVTAYLYEEKMILAEVGAESCERASDFIEDYIRDQNLKFERIDTTPTNLNSNKKGILEIIED